MKSKLKTSELLLKRDAQFEKLNEEITRRSGETLLTALREYFKTESDLQLEGMCVSTFNPNFMVLMVSFDIRIGDSIKFESGELVTVTNENYLQLATPIQLLVPLTLIDEEKDKIVETLKYIDSFVKSFSMDEYQKCVNEDKVTSVEELSKTERILQKVKEKEVKSSSVIEFDFDSLSDEQKRQVEMFKRSRKTIN